MDTLQKEIKEVNKFFDLYFRRQWVLAIMRFKERYPICWGLYGKVAMTRIIRCRKKYVFTGDNEYELLEQAIFNYRPINHRLLKGGL